MTYGKFNINYSETALDRIEVKMQKLKANLPSYIHGAGRAKAEAEAKIERLIALKGIIRSGMIEDVMFSLEDYVLIFL